jgi:hypothetical protein
MVNGLSWVLKRLDSGAGYVPGVYNGRGVTEKSVDMIPRNFFFCRQYGHIALLTGHEGIPSAITINPTDLQFTCLSDYAWCVRF